MGSLLHRCLFACVAWSTAQVLCAQEHATDQRATLVVTVDPDQGMLDQPLINQGDLPSMEAGRANHIITRDPFPSELAPGPQMQVLGPDPVAPSPTRSATDLIRDLRMTR